MNSPRNFSALDAERTPGSRGALVILTAAFLLLFLPWLLTDRELVHQETLYAVMASEVAPPLPVSAHHVAIRNGWPLYPALSAFVSRAGGIPIESAMRGLSVFMLGAFSLLAGCAAGMRRNFSAGIVTAAMCFSSLVALEKLVDGSPTSMAAFFLLAAQLLFFHFGCRRAEWNRAWIFSSLALAFGFLSGGPLVLLCFFFPMIFFRRPLSVSGKFQKTGFFIALGVLGLTLLLCWIPYRLAAGKQLPVDYLRFADFAKQSYWKELLSYPLMFPLRLLPWTLIGWFPFCVALQAIEPNPVYCRYLRTLVFAPFALLWLLPGRSPGELFYFIGPLAILTGLYYELGIRRYGRKLRKVLSAGELLSIGLAGAIAAGFLLPERTLNSFLSLGLGLAFRDVPEIRTWALAGGVALLLLAWLQHRGVWKRPVWLLILCIAFAGGLFYAAAMLPYRAQESGKRQFGEKIGSILKRKQCRALYKYDIADLYGGLYYSGIPTYKIGSLEELPKTEPVIYLISTHFPQHPERLWVNLLSDTYLKHPVGLWCGTLRPEETADDASGGDL